MDLDLIGSGLLDKLTKKQLFGEEKILDENLKYELSKYGIRFTKKGTIDKRALASKKKPIKALEGDDIVKREIERTIVETQLESDNEELPSFGDRIKASMGKHGTLIITDSDEEFQNEILGTYAKDLISKLQLRQDKKLQTKTSKSKIIEDTIESEEEEEQIKSNATPPKKITKKIIKTKVKKIITPPVIASSSDEEEEIQIEERKKNIRKKIVKEKPKKVKQTYQQDAENGLDTEDEEEEEIQPKKEVKKKTVKKPQKTEKVSTAWVFESKF